jgi:murein DD-endopeptidase MepM/ murein hydrolase activator NlpD
VAANYREIIARMTLDGKAFSSENARIFAELEKRANDAAGKQQRAFETSFESINRIAARATSVKRNDAGALDVGVTEYRAAAQAAEVHAIALREVAVAADRAARSNNDTSESTRIYVQAARAAAIEAENVAREATQQATAMERLQAELNQTASATQRVVAGNRVITDAQAGAAHATRGNAAAFAQAGQQAQDFAIQVSSGQSVLTALTQQAPQAAFVLSGVGGAVGRIATLLAGPVGTVALLGLMAVNMLRGKDAAEESTKALDVQKMSIDKLREAAKRLNDEQKRGAETSREAEQRAYDEARANTEVARALHAKAVARLRDTLAAVEANRFIGDPAERRAAEIGGAVAVNRARAQLGELSLAQVELDQIERRAQAAMVRRQVAARMDPALAATERLTTAESRLTDMVVRGRLTWQEYDRALISVRKNKDAAIEAIQETERARTKSERAAEAQAKRAAKLTSFIDPVSGPISSGFGARARPKAGASTYHPALDYGVPVGTPVKAAAAGVVIQTGTLPGFGNVVIVDHGAGTVSQYAHLSRAVAKRGQAVAQGDIIALSGNTGNSTGPHLDYRVKVRGKYVDPSKGKFLTDTGDAAADAEKMVNQSLKEQAEKREDILRQIEQANSEIANGIRLDDMRRSGFEREAEIEETILQLRAQFPDIAGKTNDELRTTLGLSEAEAQVLLDQLATAEKLTLERIKARHAADDVAELQARVKTSLDDFWSGYAQDAPKAVEAALEDMIQRQRDQVEDLADFYRDAFEGGSRGIWESFKDAGLEVLAQLAAQWTVQLASGQPLSAPGGILAQLSGGGGYGNPLLSVLGSLFGGGGNFGTPGAGPDMRLFAQQVASNYAGLPGGSGAAAASQAAGAASAAGPAGMAIAVQQGLGSLLKLNPVATLFGGVLGGLGFKMLQPVKRGSATIGLDEYGDLGVTSTRGNSRSRIQAASGYVGTLADTLSRIAEQLGGDLESVTGVSFGVRGKNIRLDPSGQGRTKTKRGAIDFGQDQEAAVRKATALMLERGVIGGISDLQKRLLASGQPIEKALAKAQLVGDIPKRLQQMLDPVGFGLDELNKRWKDTIEALKEGGASAEEMAKAQQLYRLELEETKSRTSEASAGLKDFLKDLNFGSSSPLSLRQQEEAAKLALDPFLAAIGKGERIDQAKYQEAAQRYLDVERQLYGSTGKFFEAMDLIQAATGKAISTIDSAVPIRTAADPFAEKTAANTGSMANILDQANQRLAAIEGVLERIAGGGGGDGFIGGALRSVRAASF